MIRRPPRSTQSRSSAASDVYKRQRLTSCLQCAVDRIRPMCSLLQKPDGSQYCSNDVLFIAIPILNGYITNWMCIYSLHFGLRTILLYTCLLYTSDAADDLL